MVLQFLRGPGNPIYTGLLCYKQTQFGNCAVDGASQLVNLKTTSGNSGILNSAADAIIGAANIAWNVIVVDGTNCIIHCICFRDYIASYPWLISSSSAMLLLGLFQVAIGSSMRFGLRGSTVRLCPASSDSRGELLCYFEETYIYKLCDYNEVLI